MTQPTQAAPDEAFLAELMDRRASLESRHASWTPQSLWSWFAAQAGEFADRDLVVTDDITLSYAEVRRLAVELADGLYSLGVRPGDHVAILMANYPQFVPLKFAIARVGAVAVPLNFLYRATELAYVLRQSEARVLVTMTGFAGLDYLGMLDEIAPGWDGGGYRALAELPHLRSILQLSTDGRARTGVLTVSDLAGLGRLAGGSTADIVVDPASVGDLLYTSGTTGLPKGVLVRQDATLRTGYASALTRAFEDGRRVLFSLPCYHMFGYVEGIVAAMMVGGAIIPQLTFSPVGYLGGVQRHRATDILCVPTMAIAIVEAPERNDYDVSSLKAVLCGSAPGPSWLWDRFDAELGVREIVTGYGMTETGGAQTLTRPEDPIQLSITTAGRPKSAGVAGVPDRDGDLTVYRTVDPETGEFLALGQIGELVSLGPTNMVGYWNLPVETAATLKDGWVHSGDLGLVDPNGYLVITGRKKELYKSGGELVMPREIEDLLAAHPAISQVYAIGVPDERWGEAGCACIVLAPSASIAEDEVLRMCKERLARFKVPKHVWFLEASELPLTPTGKVQKFRLVQLATARLEQTT